MQPPFRGGRSGPSSSMSGVGVEDVLVIRRGGRSVEGTSHVASHRVANGRAENGAPVSERSQICWILDILR